MNTKLDRRVKQDHDHQWIRLQDGWCGSSDNSWSDTPVSTFDKAVMVICAKCSLKKILR